MRTFIFWIRIIGLLCIGAYDSVVCEHEFTWFLSAANNGFLEVCKILLERGADARIPTDAGTTVLHYLVRHDCPDTTLLK